MKRTLQFDLAGTTLSEILEGISAKKPAPGGGAAAAAVGALAAALGRMVIAFTEGKEEFAENLDQLRKSARALDDQRRACLDLCEQDAIAFTELSRLVKRRPDDPERMQKEGDAVRAVINVPLEGMRYCLEIARRLETLAGRSNHHLRSDLAIAAVFSMAAAEACLWNVRINLPMLVDDVERSTLLAEGEGLLSQIEQKRRAIEQACREGW
ncbi:MAG: cyclodeaminase/cyclohydrolase family protein [Phycisphaerales bacterium JB040]